MRILAFTILFASFSAYAETKITCDYGFMGAPFTKIAVVLYDDGTPASSVEITPTGAMSPQKESATPEVLGENELVHLWISKERPQNTIEMVVYRNKTAEGQSKIVNENIPVGKVMWGECTGLP